MGKEGRDCHHTVFNISMSNGLAWPRQGPPGTVNAWASPELPGRHSTAAP